MTILSLETEFNNLARGLDTGFADSTDFLCQIEKEAEMEIADIALEFESHAQQMQYKNLALTRDILDGYLNIIGDKNRCLDFHANQSPVFQTAQDALNFMKAYEISSDNDEHINFFEGYLSAFEYALNSGFSHSFAKDHARIKECFNDIVYNANTTAWPQSYQSFLSSHQNNSSELARLYLTYAKFNAGLIVAAHHRQDTDFIGETLPHIYSGLENANSWLEEARTIREFLSTQKRLPLTGQAHYLNIRDIQPH